MKERLKVSVDGRRLLRADGKPFFYLGDTAWELFHLLGREDADAYLTARALQGFNVIQAVVLAEHDGLRAPNANGHLPLIDLDPARPNEAYFEDVDWVIQRGADKGLWWGLLPTWGDKWSQCWGVGPEVFNPENAKAYGKWLGDRYRDVPVIWIMGGDRAILNEKNLEVMRAMAAGIREGDGGTHLMTFHPWGGASSSQWLHGEPWLDFNMLQSGHESGRMANHAMIASDYAREPAKPCLDAEPPYENHPDMTFHRDEAAPYFDDYIARRAAWQAVFAGACGHTYGCTDVWQFYDGVRDPICRARTPWKEALHLPGACQMRHLRAFFESQPFADLVPDGSLVSAMPCGEPALALRNQTKTLGLVYFPTPGARSVQLSALSGRSLAGQWFNPRTGAWLAAGTAARASFHTWLPPQDDGPDWVLILKSV